MMDKRGLYSFVLVDDEVEIREGIQNAIPWEELGFSFAGACSNGMEALELAESIHPDVVMTDINMPFMDGLAFTERLSTICPAVKVLIISGYDDFDYARSALKLQVYDYMVKPVTPAEFKSVLTKMKADLDAERISREDLERIKKQLADSIPLLRERFLNHLVTSPGKTEDIRERAAYFGLDFPVTESAYQCIVFDFVKRREGEDFDIDLLTIRSILEKEDLSACSARPDKGRGVFFQDGENRLALIIHGSGKNELYRQGLKAAEQYCEKLESLGFSAAAGLGEAVSSLEGLPRSREGAVEALTAALLKGRAGTAAYRELVGKTNSEKAPPQWGKELSGALKTAYRDGALKQIENMTAFFKAESFTMEDYYIKLRLLLAAILQTLEEMEIPFASIFPEAEKDPFIKITELKNLDDVGLWFIALINKICDYTRERQEDFAQVKVREAIVYIETHYDDPNLTLQNLCKKMDISISYFSANLKKYGDRTFVEVLTDVRMRKAMELLKTTDMLAYEVAEKTGYRDAHYFSLSFHKYAGCTATEYRNRT
jgi:two-component system response regulator YesN